MGRARFLSPVWGRPRQCGDWRNQPEKKADADARCSVSPTTWPPGQRFLKWPGEGQQAGASWCVGGILRSFGVPGRRGALRHSPP